MSIIRSLSILALISSCLLLSACSQPKVYGSVTMSKGFNSYSSGGRMHGSVTIGGRIR